MRTFNNKIISINIKTVPFSSKDVVVASNEMFDGLIYGASRSPRKRTLHSMHNSDNSKLHSMVSAISQDSYVRPHRHWVQASNKLIDKGESFIVLQGHGKLIFFKDNGEPDRLIKLDSREQTMVWIPEGVWHTLVATSDNLIVFENKTGPWKEGEDKVFHDLYPEENQPGTDEIVSKWHSLEL